MAQKLEHTIPNRKVEFWKRVVIILLSFLLVFVVASNMKSFLYEWNVRTYQQYLNRLKTIKDEKGVAGLVEINSDCVAYLECEELGVYLPIVKTSGTDDENYYLDHDFKKQENILGSPYQKYQTKIGETTNTVFVGHSSFNQVIFGIKGTNSIFGKFNDYLYTSNNYNYNITVDTQTKKYNFKIISVIKFLAEIESVEKSMAMAIYDTVNISSQNTFDEFYAKVKDTRISQIDGLEEATYGDKFLTLFTCDTTNLDYRIMIVAKQV